LDEEEEAVKQRETQKRQTDREDEDYDSLEEDDTMFDNPKPSRKEIKAMKARQRRIEEGEEVSEEEEKIYTYRCPVYRTTLRLRNGVVSTDNSPVTYLLLKTKEHPRKWIKRSVAILLEA